MALQDSLAVAFIFMGGGVEEVICSSCVLLVLGWLSFIYNWFLRGGCSRQWLDSACQACLLNSSMCQPVAHKVVDFNFAFPLKGTHHV